MMTTIKPLLEIWAESENPPIIQLMNSNHDPVAAIYLDRADLSDIVICKSNATTDRYYMYVDGIAIFFTYYKKLDK